jgi:hypothetical protein
LFARWVPGQIESTKEADHLSEELDALLQAIKRHSYAWPFKEAGKRENFGVVFTFYKTITL